MSEMAARTPDLSDVEHWRTVGSRNLALQFDCYAQAWDRRTARWDGVAVADPSLPAAYPNSATLLAPMDEHNASDIIARLTAYYAQEPGGPWMLWSAWPTPDLSPFGMQPAGETPLMVRLPAHFPPMQPPMYQISLREATDAKGLLDFDEVMVRGYPIPEFDFPRDRLSSERSLGGPMRYFVGYDGSDLPVSSSAALIGESEVGVYAIATLPEQRRKGFGATLTRTAILTAPHLPAVLEASAAGEPIYRQMGFVTVSMFTLWYRPRG